MLTSGPPQPGLIDRFGHFIMRLKQAVADGSGRNKALMGPLTILLWNYLSRTLARLAALHARFVAGKLEQTPRAARPATERKAPERRAEPVPDGLVFVPFYVSHLYHALRELIEDPEMVALLQAAPQAGRILRPLWRRMTADPLPAVLRLPKRPRQARPAPAPETEDAKPPPAAAPVRRPKPRPDRPLPAWRVVLNAPPFRPPKISRA